jgi:hypothetical protein
MVEPFFISGFFLDFILPFVLVFTLIFAILSKTKVLGEDKKQINALLGLIIGIILIAFPFARNIVVQLMPFLAVSAVILFVFMLMYAFIWGKSEDTLDKWVKIVLGVIFSLGLITVLLFITGYWDAVYNFIFKRGTGQVWINILLMIVMAGAIIAVRRGEKSSE